MCERESEGIPHKERERGGGREHAVEKKRGRGARLFGGGTCSARGEGGREVRMRVKKILFF